MTKKIKPLSSIEWDTLWMAIRYAMNGQTIATASLPPDIIKHYYHRLAEEQRKRIAEDLKRHFNQLAVFGDPQIDNKIWLKFYHALDVSKHKTAIGVDDTEYVVFEVLGVIYPLAQYLNAPHSNISLPVENIKSINR